MARRGPISAITLAAVLLLFASCDNFSLISQFSASLSSTPAPLSISPASTGVQVGATVNFSASGGTAPYTYSVQAGGAGGTIYPLSGAYTAPTTTGTDTVIVTDSAGATASASVVIVAASQLVISPTTVTISASGSSTSTYQFAAVGGVAPYTYTLSSGSGTVSSSGLYTAPSSATSAAVTVKDSVGSTSTATVTVVSGGPLAISPSTPQVQENSSITFAGSGGTPPYTFTSTGEGSINASTGAYVASGSAGTNVATITVTDSAMTPAQVTTQVTIVPEAPSNLTIAAAVGTMTLSWQNNSLVADKVVIERATGSGGTFSVIATIPTTTTYVDSVTPNGALYVYQVYAEVSSSSLISPASNQVFAVASP